MQYHSAARYFRFIDPAPGIYLAAAHQQIIDLRCLRPLIRTDANYATSHLVSLAELAAIIRSGAIVVSLAIFAVLYTIVVVVVLLVSIISLGEPVALPGPTCSPMNHKVHTGLR